MKTARIQRKIKTLTFSENGTETVEIPRGYDLNSVTLRLRGSYIIGTAVVTSVKTLAPAALIKKISLYGDGNQKFATTTGRLAAWAAFERGNARNVTAPGVTVATHAVECSYFLDRVNADGPRPKDSALHTQNPYMSLLQMDVEFGALADIVVIGSAVLTHDLYVDVFVDQTIERDPGGAFEGRWVRRCTLQEINVTASNSAYEIKVPVGGYLRGAKILALNDNDLPDDTVVTNVTLKSGVDVRLNLPFDQLQNSNIQQFGMQSGDLSAGIAYADVTDGGKLNTLFDLTNKSEATLELDLTKPSGGNGKVWVELVHFYWQDALPENLRA